MKEKKLIILLFVIILIVVGIALIERDVDEKEEANRIASEEATSNEIKEEDLIDFVSYLNKYAGTMNVYLQSNLSDDEASNIREELNKIDGIAVVSFVENEDEEDEGDNDSDAEDSSLDSYLVRIYITEDNYLNLDEIQNEILEISGVNSIKSDITFDEIFNLYAEYGIDLLDEKITEQIQ